MLLEETFLEFFGKFFAQKFRIFRQIFCPKILTKSRHREETLGAICWTPGRNFPASLVGHREETFRRHLLDTGKKLSGVTCWTPGGNSSASLVGHRGEILRRHLLDAGGKLRGVTCWTPGETSRRHLLDAGRKLRGVTCLKPNRQAAPKSPTNCPPSRGTTFVGCRTEKKAASWCGLDCGGLVRVGLGLVGMGSNVIAIVMHNCN